MNRRAWLILHLLFLYFIPFFIVGCSDIAHIQRGDHFFNQSNYSAAIEEYEKVVSLTSNRKSPYYGLPTGEEAKKKIEISNLALQSKENFSKGNEEFWKGKFQSAAQFYQEIDPQFLTAEESAVYEKNRKEILSFLAAHPPEIEVTQKSQERALAVAKKIQEPPQLEVPRTAPRSEPSPATYFPLPPGWKYHYRASIPIGQKVIVQNFQEEVLPEKILKERRVFPVQKWQGGKITETLYYERSEGEVRLVAEQKASASSATFLDFPVTEIKLPVEPGTSWTVLGKPRVIVGEEEASTASGHYSNCLKIVEQQGELVRISRWYAPGIGLVKLQKTTFPGKSHETHQILELVKIERK